MVEGAGSGGGDMRGVVGERKSESSVVYSRDFHEEPVLIAGREEDLKSWSVR